MDEELEITVGGHAAGGGLVPRHPVEERGAFSAQFGGENGQLARGEFRCGIVEFFHIL